MNDRAILNAILQQRPAAFTRRCFQTVVPGQTYLSNWHIDAIVHHLELCRRKRIRRLIITLPPRNMKSICASVAFPAYVLGHKPDSRIICASYSQDLADKHARDCRAVVGSDWYRRVFPQTKIDHRKNADNEFATTAGGFRLATSVGGTLTGRGGNLIIVDDPMKPNEAMSEARREAVKQWYDNTLVSRLDNKIDDVIIVIMQRLHVDDLVGHLLETGDEWTVLNLPAIAEVPQDVVIGDGLIHHRNIGDLLHPEREDRKVLDEIKSQMGSLLFSAQYQQAPVPPGGALIKWPWFQTYTVLPEQRGGRRIVQSWDTASKASSNNDYSVCTTWLIDRKDYYLLDVLRGRFEYPDLRRRILAHAEAFGATTVLIEDAGSGTPLIQDLRSERRLRPIAIRPEGDKIVRMEAQSALIEAGHVFVPESAPWLGDFQSEMMAFPNGRHDDQIDSVSQFLGWASRNANQQYDIAKTLASTLRELKSESPGLYSDELLTFSV